MCDTVYYTQRFYFNSEMINNICDKDVERQSFNQISKSSIRLEVDQA